MQPKIARRKVKPLNVGTTQKTVAAGAKFIIVKAILPWSHHALATSRMVLAATCLIALGRGVLRLNPRRQPFRRKRLPPRPLRRLRLRPPPTPRGNSSRICSTRTSGAGPREADPVEPIRDSSNKPIRVNQSWYVRSQGEPLVAVFKDEGYAGWSGAGPARRRATSSLRL